MKIALSPITEQEILHIERAQVWGSTGMGTAKRLVQEIRALRAVMIEANRLIAAGGVNEAYDLLKIKGTGNL